MTNEQINLEVLQRFSSTQSFWGRRKLIWNVQCKRALWRVATASADGVKRAFDAGVSLVVIILFSPLFLLIYALVRLDGGPAIFRQTRIGQFGRPFRILKFRSMHIDAESKLKDLLALNQKHEGVTFKMKNDPRITPVGRWLRKTSLDELVQFFNVLRGDMSLVGPRPPVPREVALYTQSDRRRLLVKPGITCLWQIGERKGGIWEVGDRNQIDFGEQVNLDVRYIEVQSFWRDVWILVKTIPAVLFGKGE